MNACLKAIIIELDPVTKQVDKQIKKWLQEIAPEIHREFCPLLIGPWIKDKKLYVRLVPRFIKGADMQWIGS